MNQPKPRAALAYVHPGDVRASFMYSVVRAFAHEAATHGAPFLLLSEACPSGDLPEARNRLVAHFLDHTDADWYWSADGDMGFGPATLDRLIRSAHPVARPIMGALCFGLRRVDDDDELQAVRFETFPTLYTWEEHGDLVGFRIQPDYPRDQVVPVAATGAACLLIHRSALEAIRSKHGDTWFDKVTHPTGRRFSEDLSLCVRAAGCDLPIFVDTSIPTSHDKNGVFLTAEEFDRQRGHATRTHGRDALGVA